MPALAAIVPAALVNVLCVGVGAGIGGVLRYGAGRAVESIAGGPTTFPWATLGVNAAGCLAIGVLAAVLGPGAEASGPEAGAASAGHERARLFWMVGVLGGFTTFSAFARESVALLESGRWGLCALYVLASNALGLAGAWVGMRGGR